MTRRFLVNITERPIFRFESLEVFLYSHFDNILGVFTRMRPEKKNDSEHLHFILKKKMRGEERVK